MTCGLDLLLSESDGDAADFRIALNGSATAWRAFVFAVVRRCVFFGGGGIGAMADCRHHGEGEHHQGNVAMPPMPDLLSL